jgi:ribonucleoside-diphosphate reductase alpha chain
MFHPLWKKVEGSTLMGDTALRISPDWHLAHMWAWQKNIDNAVSKTVNLRNDATPETVSWVYKEAFNKGLKGVTIYRDGSREEQALRAEVGYKLSPPMKVNVREGVERYPAHVYKMNSGCGFVWVIVAERDDSMQALEHTFVLTDGGCAANNESTGRGISEMMQCNVPIDRITGYLGKVKCLNAMKNPKSDGKSCSDIIGKCIRMEYDDFVDKLYPRIDTSTPSFDFICPVCKQKLDFGRGCANGTCPSCGWSGCS